MKLWIFAISLVVLSPLWVNVATADNSTTITVEFNTKSTRIRPSYRQGETHVSGAIVLETTGAVSETLSTIGPRPYNFAKTRVLGQRDGRGTVRVVNANTIERVADFRTHILRIVVRVNGKSCTASVSFQLKPGQKEYESYSTELGTSAIFSSIRAVDPTCSIR
jgi:hypothetical protein